MEIQNICIFSVCTGRVAVNVSTLVLHWQKVLYYIMSLYQICKRPSTAHCFICQYVLPFNLLCDALQRPFPGPFSTFVSTLLV